MANAPTSSNAPSNSGTPTGQQGQTSNAPVVVAGNTIENKKDAIKTYIEQTKLLITLASAFIIAPAVVFKDLASVSRPTLIGMEVFFIASVLSSYVVMGAITGTQNKGEYDVDRPAIRIWSIAQLFCYIIGLGIFISGLLQPGSVAKIPTKPMTDTVKSQTIINNYHSNKDKRPVKPCRKK